MASKHEEVLNCISLREMQIKATMEYFYTPAGTAKVKWQATLSVAKDVELSYIADGYVN